MLYQQPQGGPATVDPVAKFVSVNVLGRLSGYDCATGMLSAVVGTKFVSTPRGTTTGFGVSGVASNDRVLTGLNTQSSSRTYITRFNRAGGGGAGSGRIFDKFRSSDSSGNFLFWYGADSNVNFAYFTGNIGANFIRIPNCDQLNTDYTVAVSHTYDGTNNTVVGYVNGVQVCTSTIAGPYIDSPGTPITIGNRSYDLARNWDGEIDYLYVADRVIGAAEIASYYANPYQLFLDQDEDDEALMFAAVGGATGTLAAQNAADSTSSAGSTTVVGSLARSNAADTVSAAGAVGSSISGALATSNASDTAAASGSPSIVGSLARSNAGDTAAASGSTTVHGAVAYANTSDSGAASGVAGAVAGTVNYTNNADQVAAAGSGGLAVAGGGAGFEMVSLEPSWKRALRMRAEKTEKAQRVELTRKQRKRAEFIEKLAAKEAASAKPEAQIDARLSSLLAEWIALAPMIDLTPVAQVSYADAYRAFMDRVAGQAQRLKQEDEDDENAAEMLLLM